MKPHNINMIVDDSKWFWFTMFLKRYFKAYKLLHRRVHCVRARALDHNVLEELWESMPFLSRTFILRAFYDPNELERYMKKLQELNESEQIPYWPFVNDPQSLDPDVIAAKHAITSG